MSLSRIPKTLQAEPAFPLALSLSKGAAPGADFAAQVSSALRQAQGERRMEHDC